MKEFVLLFRMNITSADLQPDKEQMDDYKLQWIEWIKEIAGNHQLADGGNHLARSRRVLMPDDEILEMPYVANNNSVAGYIIILAEDMDDATQIAKKCPILKGQNTSVEIRETASPGE